MSANEDAHESAIKTPQQLIIVVVLSFVVPVIFLIMFAQFVLSATKPDASETAAEAVAARIRPVAEVNLVAGDAGGGAARGGEEVVKAACAACHTTGAAGAPKIGDKGGWAVRLGLGADGLTKSAIKGKNAMPARGGVPDLSDFEIARAVVYMANQSGASFKEPAEPKAAKTAAK
jgi:cytochrome c5